MDLEAMDSTEYRAAYLRLREFVMANESAPAVDLTDEAGKGRLEAFVDALNDLKGDLDEAVATVLEDADDWEDVIHRPLDASPSGGTYRVTGVWHLNVVDGDALANRFRDKTCDSDTASEVDLVYAAVSEMAPKPEERRIGLEVVQCFMEVARRPGDRFLTRSVTERTFTGSRTPVARQSPTTAEAAPGCRRRGGLRWGAGADQPSAAETTSRASAWTCARCSGPLKDSA